jgi:hypothetical protein
VIFAGKCTARDPPKFRLTVGPPDNAIPKHGGVPVTWPNGNRQVIAGPIPARQQLTVVEEAPPDAVRFGRYDRPNDAFCLETRGGVTEILVALDACH